MTEKIFRNKIYWFTFLFSVLVIWVHSYNAVLFLGNTGAAASLVRLERFFGDKIAQIAVPGFFMISSYLFFRGYKPEILMRKWNSRIRSVLVPYIVWNSLYYFGYVIGSRLPCISDVIGKGKIPFGLLETVDAILNYTYNYVFWYLYQLILLILLAPLIYLAVKRVWPGIVFLAILLTGVYLGIVSEPGRAVLLLLCGLRGGTRKSGGGRRLVTETPDCGSGASGGRLHLPADGSARQQPGRDRVGYGGLPASGPGRAVAHGAGGEAFRSQRFYEE